MVLAASEVPPHVAHGDGYSGAMVPGQPDTRFGPACELVPLQVVTITFGDLTDPNGTPFASYEAQGVTVKSTLRSWQVMAGYGNPKPAIIFLRQASEPDAIGEVQVTSATGPFVFSGVDVYSSVTKIPYEILGSRKQSPVFSQTGTIPNTFGAFKPISNPGSEAIDLLVIRLTNPATPCCGNPTGLDNITVKR